MQRQEQDDAWYTCINHVRVLGKPLCGFVPYCPSPGAGMGAGATQREDGPNRQPTAAAAAATGRSDADASGGEGLYFGSCTDQLLQCQNLSSMPVPPIVVQIYIHQNITIACALYVLNLALHIQDDVHGFLPSVVAPHMRWTSCCAARCRPSPQRTATWYRSFGPALSRQEPIMTAHNRLLPWSCH
jgi:uncharacterized protein Usg